MAGSTRFVRDISKTFLSGVQCLTYFRITPLPTSLRHCERDLSISHKRVLTKYEDGEGGDTSRTNFLGSVQ